MNEVVLKVGGKVGKRLIYILCVSDYKHTAERQQHFPHLL